MNWSDRYWEAERTFESLKDLRDDPLLSNTSMLGQTAPSRSVRMDDSSPDAGRADIGTFDSPDEFSEKDNQHKYRDVWRIHDLKHNKLIVVTPDHPIALPLYVGDWPYPLDYTGASIDVYHPLVFNDVADYVAGISDVDFVRALQEELNEVLASRRDHVNRFKTRKLIREAGAWDDKAISQFRNPNNYEVVVNPGGVAKTLIFDAVPYPQDAYAYEVELRQHIRRFLGVYEKETGVAKSDTATEAQLMANFQASRFDDRRQRMGSMVERAVFSILQLHKAFTSTDLIVRFTGSEGIVWQRLKGNEIPDKLRVNVDLEGWASANPELRKRQFLEALPHLLNNQYIDQRKIAKKALEVLLGERNPDKYLYTPQQLEQMRQRRMQEELIQTGKKAELKGKIQGRQQAAKEREKTLGQVAGNAAASQLRPVRSAG